VASKFNESDLSVPSLRQLKDFSGYGFPRDVLLQSEGNLLEILNWDLMRATSYDYA